MDKNRIEKIEKELEGLVAKLDSLSMSKLYEAPQMQTVEKRLNAKIAILINTSLSSVNERLKQLGEGITSLIQAIKDGVESNKKLTTASMNYYESLKKWSRLLALATFLLVLVGSFQGCLLWRYTKETQNLSKVAQEQLDLQLQPALVIASTKYSSRFSKTLELINIGNGAASNIRITCVDKPWQFVHLPDFLDTKDRRTLWYIETNEDLFQIPEAKISRESESRFHFNSDDQLSIKILYENINNKEYYTEMIISSEGAKIKSRGQVTD